MKRLSPWKPALLTVLLLITVQLPATAQTDASFDRQKMNTYLNKLDAEQKFMGSVALDSAGTKVYNHSVGFIATQDDTVMADGQTVYRIGSITKTFTAAMIMQLIEEGKLSLSTKLAKYYPDIPQADSVMVEHLLRHQSGLYNFTNAPDYTSWMTEERSKEQLLDVFRNDTAQFSPGSQTRYSNTNYVLLGFIIEDITGESYAAQLKKSITQPLGLEHTYYGDRIDPVDNEAASFGYSKQQWNRMPETDMSVPGGAGAIVSTPDDLTDFITALFEGELVSQVSLEKMTTINEGMGLGLTKIPFYNTFAYGHGGGIDGFQSHLAYFPDPKVATAFTGNALNYPMNNILIGVLSIYFGKEFEIPDFDTPTISLGVDEMQKYVGSYGSDQLPLEIEVFVKDSTLMAQATGQPAIPLTATNKTTMRFEQAGLVMEFDSLANDQYHQFTLKQGGGQFLFMRKDKK